MEDFYKDWLFRQYDMYSEYTGVLSALYSTVFISKTEMDRNLGLDANIARWNYSGVIDHNQSNCLEVIYALAVKLNNLYYEKNVSDWIGIMLENLGLNKYPDYAYSPEYVFYIINAWLSRSYREDGLGSLFYIPGATDIPNIDIWMAAHRYLMKIANGVR